VKGLPLILLPGMLCDEFYWREQIRALSDISDCSVADYGVRASFDDMAADILRTAPPRFALASHSMGGRVAFEIYRQAPERVALLGLFGTAYTANGVQEAAYRHEMLDLANREGMRGLGQAWVKRMVHPDRLNDAPLVDSIIDMVTRKSLTILRSQVHASMTRRDATGLLPRISCPTLVLCGRQDAARPLPAHEEMAVAIPNSTLVVIENCGHMCMLERPDELSQAMRKWLGSLNPYQESRREDDNDKHDRARRSSVAR
jgi:pimeloyl-ACP methyl ester carboxylesterase